MTTPTLQTSRLLLRPVARSDAAAVFAYASNPAVSRYVTWEGPRTLADSEAFIETVLARGPTECTWAICLLPDPMMIGVIEFGLISPDEADFHYVLAEPYWNRGLTTEAARAVLAWGLAHYPDVRRVVTCAVAENIASQRVMEKCGLTFVRSRLDRWAKFDKPLEQREFALTRDRT